ncbi:MAG: phosphate ABC transporter permease subunit PstC [Clostridia bacterium]|nr:phosphate ABC transporter permease subunit PstC [Clostridia bacterium]
MDRTKVKEIMSKALFAIAAVICIIAVVAIFVFLILESFPAFKQIGFFKFLFGANWKPNGDDAFAGDVSGSYGVLKMLVGTLLSTVGALIIGGVLGVFTAVFISRFCPKRIKGIFNTVVNLLAGIPSVVYGFFGIYVLLPMLGFFSPNGSGSGILATSIVLGIMILPTVVSLSKTSIDAVPQGYYEGARALGATHEQAVYRAVVPAAKSGIVASLILALGRALGETMAVTMVAGNAVNYPTGLFKSFRTLTANIVLEMGYAGELQMGALVATGVVLLLFVLAVNLLTGLITGRKKSGGGRKKTAGFLSKIFYKVKLEKIGRYVSWACAIFAGVALVSIVGWIVVNGVSHLSWDFVFGNYSVVDYKRYTIGPSIIATLMVVALSIVVSVPLGVATAIYLNEYSKKGSEFVKIIRTAVDILSGVPSIVYALFGAITFKMWFGGTISILAGSLTITLMLLPIVIRSTEESLKTVSDGLREGSFALGAGKVRTIFKIVLPSALPGIISAVILAMGRVISESAPFIYTMGSSIQPMPDGYMSSGTTLAVALYRFASEGKYMNEAYATAFVLIVIVLGLNLLAEWLGKILNRKLKGETNAVRKKRNS